MRPPSDGQIEATAKAAEHNLHGIAEFERAFLREYTSTGERVGNFIGKFAGTWEFLLVHVVLVLGYTVVNVGLIPGLRPFDEWPFDFLQLVLGIEAIFLSTFILIRQNRMSRQADQRAHLDLQISLLAEQETTKMLQMLQRICDRLGLDEEANDEETLRLSQQTHLETLVRQMQEKLPSEDDDL